MISVSAKNINKVFVDLINIIKNIVFFFLRLVRLRYNIMLYRRFLFYGYFVGGVFLFFVVRYCGMGSWDWDFAGCVVKMMMVVMMIMMNGDVLILFLDQLCVYSINDNQKCDKSKMQFIKKN